MACLHRALEEKRYTYVTLNLKWGEDPQYQDEKGRNLLMKLCFFERDTKWSVTTARRLMRIPGTRDVVDNDGRDILMHCIRNKKVGMARLVLHQPDFDISKIDKFGYNALHYAAELGVEPITKLLARTLLQYEMNVDVITPAGMTALMLACREGHVDCARVLITDGNASLTMKDDIHFKGPKDWLSDSYLVPEGMDPFIDGANLRKRCLSAKTSNRPRRGLTSMRRTRSANCLYCPDGSGRDTNPSSAENTPKPPTQNGFFAFSAITPVKHVPRRMVESKYPNTPTIIFEDSTGHTCKAPSPRDSNQSTKADDSYVPVLYKLFTASGIQTSSSFRPTVRKVRPPTPEPEPEPEPPKQEEEDQQQKEMVNKLAARIKLKKALKLKRTEGLLDSLKKGAKKSSGEKQNAKSMNINDLMANLKRKQTKSELVANSQGKTSTDTLKDKLGKLKKFTKHISAQSVKKATTPTSSNDASGMNMDVSTDAGFEDKYLLKPS